MVFWLVLVAIGLLALSLRNPKSPVRKLAAEFEWRFRVWADLQLVPGIVYHSLRHTWQCQVSHRYSTWYDIENTCLSPKHANTVAIKWVHEKQGKSFRKDGEDAFQVDQYTYKQMYDAVLRLSYILANEYDIKKGDTVTMLFMNKPTFVFLWLALWNIGACPAFVNYNLKHKPLVHSIKVVKCHTLLVDAKDCKSEFKESESEVLEAVPGINIHFLDEDELLKTILDPISPQFRLEDSLRDKDVQPWTSGVLLYTSGTTGMPKAASNSWRKIFFASYFFSTIMKMKSKSNMYTAMPLYHGTASILGVMPAFAVGGTISLGFKFSVSSYWTQVKLCKANTIQYVGEVCRYLVDAAETVNEKECYGQVDIAIGNGLRKDIWQKFKDRFGIRVIGEFYASSESPFATTCYEVNGNGIGALRNNGTLANLILGHVMYTLVRTDPQDDNTIYRNAKGFCEEPGPSENGEMVTRIWNPQNIRTTFPGYTNNDQETYSKILRNVFHKGDAWVRSDDLMKYDEIGNIYFVDRLGDTYRWKSENVSTTEVEGEILEGVPEIEFCVVVGCRVDKHEGRCGYAILEPRNKQITAKEKEHILDALATSVYNNLPHFARPCFVRFDTIEMNSSHKVSKKRFRDPVLPAGPNGTQSVYYLNTKTKKYELLTDEILQGIVSQRVRI